MHNYEIITQLKNKIERFGRHFVFCFNCESNLDTSSITEVPKESKKNIFSV
jgi:hypothetical protein